MPLRRGPHQVVDVELRLPKEDVRALLLQRDDRAKDHAQARGRDTAVVGVDRLAIVAAEVLERGREVGEVEQTRERLKSNPWIADATVLKLYPGELQIGIKEREPFALWQKDRHVCVIAADGTVLEPYVAPHLLQLPLVVGRGADTRAKEFLALLDRYPAMRDVVRASVLVGERRWNLRLKNGVDVRLPETDIAPALERLVALDKEKNLTTRDIVAIDLRLPDRVTVRLSEAAAQARIDAAKDKAKKKGGSA